MPTNADDTSRLVGRTFESAAAPGTVRDALLRKLLLVDDEGDGAEFAAILLRSNGIPVAVAHSAAEALRTLQSDRDIDVLLTDVMMPAMTGLELADAVRAKYPTMKIVLMSGYVRPELLKDLTDSYLFIEKPYKIDTLLKLLRG